MKKNKDRKLVGALAALLAVGAAAGGGLLAYRAIKSLDSSSSSSQASSSQAASDSSDKSQVTSESTSTADSSSTGGDSVSTTPYLQGNKTDIKWYATESVTATLPYESYQCTIHDLPSTATGEAYSHLYMYSDDDTLADWVEIYTMDSGTKNVLSSPYDFESGQTVYFQLLKGVSATTEFYKIPIWIYSYSYDKNTVYALLQIWIYPEA